MKTTFIGICRDKFDSSRIFIDAPMRLHTTFCIGGPADLLFYPKNIEEVQHIIQIAAAYEQPITLLGNGSNILVQDGGILHCRIYGVKAWNSLSVLVPC